MRAITKTKVLAQSAQSRSFVALSVERAQAIAQVANANFVLVILVAALDTF